LPSSAPGNVHVGEHEIDPVDALHRDADRFVGDLRIDVAANEILEHERERLAKKRVVLHNRSMTDVFTFALSSPV